MVYPRTVADSVLRRIHFDSNFLISGGVLYQSLVLRYSLNDFGAISQVFVHNMVKVIRNGLIVDPTAFVKLVSRNFFVFMDPGSNAVHQLLIMMVHGLGCRGTL